MEPYSYFLPQTYLKNKTTCSNENKTKSVQKYSSVYSHRINEYIDQKKLTGNGRTITFGKRDDTNFTFTSYQVATNNEFIQSQNRKFSVHTDFDYSLYCCSNEICFMFKLRKNNGVYCTKIDVSCIRFDAETGKSILQENIAVLQYNHVFNQYSCSLSDVERKLVIITGRDLDSYGTKLEMVDNYMDILSYRLDDHSNVVTKHEKRKNLTDACKLYDIDRIFFSLCGTKLFFVFGKVFVVYSTTLDLFGDIFELSDSDQFHMTRYCFYVHNKFTGNLLVMCQSDGFIYTIREKNLVLELLTDQNLYLSDFGFNDEVYVFLHVDSFDDVLLYYTIGYELFILDYLRRQIVGKYIPTKQHYIVDVKTNWSGEEVFVFHGIANTRQQLLNILYMSKRDSLKNIAKLKVLQTYSTKQLKELNLPPNLKVEMKVL